MRLAIFTVLLGVPALSALPGQEPLTLVRSIALPAVEGRIDHLAYDAADQKLFVAALGNNTVEVLDVRAGTHVKSLRDFREPQGIAVAADARLIAVADGAGEGVQLLSASDYQARRPVRLGDDSDNVRYDASSKRLYVGYGRGALAAVSPANVQVIGETKLPGHPESFQLERSGPRIFVNVPTADRIVVVDREAMKVTASWPVVSARSNFPMALDEPGHRLFIGCRRPAKVLVYDTTSGKEIASAEIVGDTDDLFYDSARHRLYVTGGEGYIDVLQTDNQNRLSRIARIPTAPGARTALFVPDLAQLYVAVPRRGDQKAEVRVYEAH